MGFKNDKAKKQFIAEVFLVFQKLQTITRQHLNLSKKIINVVLGLSMFQPLTFLSLPILDSQLGESMIMFITLIVRPDYLMKRVNFEYFKSSLSFLFVIFAQTLEYLFIVIILIAFWDQLIGNMSIQKNMKHWQRIILKTLSIYSYLFSTYLYIPFMVLLVESARDNLSDSTGWLILSIIGIIYCIVAQFQKVIFCSESVNLIIYGNEKLELTKSDFLKEILVLAQIFSYILVNSFRVGEVIQSILTLLISSLYLIQLFEYRIIGDRNQCLIIIVTQSITISYVLCNLVKSDNNFFLYFTGLFYNIMLKLFQYQENDMYQIISNCQRIKVIKQFMAFQINNEQKPQRNLIQQAIELSQHKVKCQDQQCFCQNKIEYQEDPLRVNFLSLNLQKKLRINRLKYMNKIINSDKSKQSEIHYIQYTSALNIFGQTTAAFQQCNQLLYGFEMQNKSLVQSQAFSNRTLRSQSSSAKTQNNKGSIDFKIQSIKEKQIKKSEKIYLKQGARNISEIGRYKLQLLQLDIRTRMQQNFIKNQNSQQQEISEAVVLFLDSEEKNQSLKQQIVKSIEIKFKFYQILLNRKNIQSLTLFNKAKDLSQKFIDLEEQLNYQYEQFPSQKLQSVICFFQAEILNNYLKAFKIANFNAVSDDKLINMRKNLKVNLFAKNVVYMIVKLQEGFQTLEICKKSNNAHEFFNYSFEEFQRNTYIDYLLPDAIKNEHMALVQRFIQTGSSRFFRNQNISFLRQSSGFIRPINLFFDISTVQLDQLTFAVFFEELQGTQMFLIVDVNGYLSGISKSIIEKLGFHQNVIHLFEQQILEISYQKIEIIIPQFYRLISEDCKQYNITLRYFNPKILEVTAFRSYEKRAYTQDIWRNEEKLQTFTSTLTVHKREIYGYYYYVVEMEEIKSSNNSNTKELCEGVNAQELEVSQNIDSININSSLDEADVNKPNAITIYQNNENIFEESSELNSKIQSRSFQIQQYHGLSANATLNDTSKNVIQQKFFNLNLQEQIQDEESIIQNEIKAQKLDANKLYEVDFDKIDKDMQDNIRQQLQLDKDQQSQENKFIDDIGSQVSSLAGVRKSAFFKKYDVICKLIQIQQLPRVFFLTNLLIVIFFLFTIIYYIIVLSNTEQDFNRFLKETDMLTFNQAFMSPWDQFLNIRLTTSSYQTMLSQRLITNQTYQIVYNWLYDKLNDGYEDIKNNFLEQFSNDYIQDFFTDQYMAVRVQNANQTDLVSKNLTFRESLFMLLSYQFQSKTAYQQRKQVVNLPFTTYAWANYFLLHEQFNNMTIEIYQYTLVQKDIVFDKWIEIWIIFLVVSLLLVSLNYYIYIKYRAYYEQYLDLFKYIDNFSLERDLEKYKILGSILNKDQDVMFKYVFDLEQKEKFMLTEKYKKDAQLKVTKDKRHGLAKLQKLPHFQSVLVFGILFSVFFTCSIIIQFQTIDYLNKYANTATAYKKLAYLDLAVSSSFAHRLVGIYFRLWPFYVASDKVYLYKQFNSCIQDMQDFMVEFTSFNEQEHLTTDSFIDLLQDVKTGSVCSILPNDVYQDVKYYCPLSYQGALQQGLYQSLNYIINYLLTDQQINNFTQFTTYTLYDIEGVYIIQKATKILMREMKFGLVSATELKISQTSGLSIFYITYAILALFIQLFIISKYLIKEFKIVKRFILLLPSSTVLLDDLLERCLRIQVAREN